MKKNRLLVAGITLCMLGTMVTPAFAAPVADGVEAESPKGAGLENESNGEAIITSADGIDFYTEKDDDALAKDLDTSGADINVWAKVVDSGSKIYKVDLAWGAMKFEYNSGSGQWNTTTHTYDSASGAAAWTETGFVDGTNNKIAITNHSNNGVDAGLAYAMNGVAFNATATEDNAVLGRFYADNTKALAGAKILTGTHAGGAAVAYDQTTDKVQLETADKYTPESGTEEAAGARTKDVFFSFSGTPDDGVGKDLDTFKKVGIITVTISPTPVTAP